MLVLLDNFFGVIFFLCFCFVAFSILNFTLYLIMFLLIFFPGHGLKPENGWNVMVVARLEEKELATSPVPLTSQPKFEEEMSWTISSKTLYM